MTVIANGYTIEPYIELGSRCIFIDEANNTTFETVLKRYNANQSLKGYLAFDFTNTFKPSNYQKNERDSWSFDSNGYIHGHKLKISGYYDKSGSYHENDDSKPNFLYKIVSQENPPSITPVQVTPVQPVPVQTVQSSVVPVTVPATSQNPFNDIEFIKKDVAPTLTQLNVDVNSLVHSLDNIANELKQINFYIAEEVNYFKKIAGAYNSFAKDITDLKNWKNRIEEDIVMKVKNHEQILMNRKKQND